MAAVQVGCSSHKTALPLVGSVEAYLAMDAYIPIMPWAALPTPPRSLTPQAEAYPAMDAYTPLVPEACTLPVSQLSHCTLCYLAAPVPLPLYAPLGPCAPGDGCMPPTCPCGLHP